MNLLYRIVGRSLLTLYLVQYVWTHFQKKTKSCPVFIEEEWGQFVDVFI